MMKIKRFFAAALVLVMALAVTACHTKDETAVTVGDVKFTSAYYMCALINADSEAKSKVQENISASESSDASTTSSTTSSTSSDVDYYSQKLDDKTFVKWVEDTALENLKKIAAYKILCKENELEISDEDSSNAESYASYYWSSYGYSAYFEPNGVGQTTYTQYMKDSYYSNLYFEHLYGAEGEKAISADEVKTKIYDNFIIADVIEVSFSSKTDDEITELKEKMNNYVTKLTDGSMTFEQVYKDYNGTTDETDDTSTTDSETPQPQDKYAQVLGAADTAYESDNYDTVKAMATNEIKLIELDDAAGLVLAVKKDIQADSYYLDSLDLSARHLIKDTEYEETINEYVKKLDVKTSKYAISQFKVKKIKEPETQS